MDKSDTIKGGEDNLNPLDSPDKIRGVTNYTDAFSYARETMLYTDALIVKLMKEQDNEN